MLGSRRTWRAAALDAGRLPVVGPMVEAAYGRYFHDASGPNVRLFRGTFADFASAQAAIPEGKAAGYDNVPSASRNVNEWLVVYPSDYPVMFWLTRLLPGCRSLFDWGGNVGLKYFTYRKYLDYPEDFRWVVADVPSVVELGRATAAREDADGLHFTSTLEELGAADVLLAAGSLHYIADPFATLRALPGLPRHFILNKVPAHRAPSVWTLNNMGTAMCPYRLFNRDELIAEIRQLGYRLVDAWESPDVRCELPFHPEYRIEAYSGFYFTKT